MSRERRHRFILERIEAQRQVHVTEAARELDVSEATVRRDLEALESAGVVIRVHGGAVAADQRSRALGFLTRSVQNVEEKRRIGRAVADLLRDGEAVILDAGTTNLEAARALVGRKSVRVLTGDLRIAECLADDAGVQVMMPPGDLRPHERVLIGSAAENYLLTRHFDTVVLGVAALDGAAGVTEPDVGDASLKQAALRSGRRRIVAADSSKLGNVAFAEVCGWKDLDLLVTDTGARGTETAEAAGAAGVEVLFV